MEKKIEDYLHLYLGCKVQYVFTTRTNHQETRIGILDGIKSNGAVSLGIVVSQTHWDEYRLYKLKPLLRPLSSMTVKEICTIFNEAFAPSFATDNIKAVSGSLFGLHKLISEYGDFDSIQKLLKLGFDLFGLIDAGLAIDSTNLKPTEK